MSGLREAVVRDGVMGLVGFINCGNAGDGGVEVGVLGEGAIVELCLEGGCMYIYSYQELFSQFEKFLFYFKDRKPRELEDKTKPSD